MTTAWRSTGMVLAMLVAALSTMALLPRTCSAEEAEATPVIPDEEWNDETRLWLARSLLGEVGWRRPGEQAAVAWVYATRAELSDRYDFLEMVKTYSAAVRAPGKRRSPWLFQLDFEGTRPKAWPVDPVTGQGPLWRGLHRKAWLEVIDLVDEWRLGKIPNPCPGANHFGGYVDRHRAEAMRWVRVKCSIRTRNLFYNSHRLRKVVTWQERLQDLRKAKDQ